MARIRRSSKLYDPWGLVLHLLQMLVAGALIFFAALIVILSWLK